MGTGDRFREDLKEANEARYGRGLGIIVKSDFIPSVCLPLIELTHLL